MSFVPIILCGGQGKRLWPISRLEKPKPFLKISGNLSLLQQTLQRCTGPQFDQRPIIICNEAHRHFAERDVREIGSDADILLEPESRDSCPALAVAALHANSRAPSRIEAPLLLSLAADHAITDQLGFTKALEGARSTADQGYLVTFGIAPTSEKANYGYIKPGSEIQPNVSNLVEKFIEKPDPDKVFQLIQDGFIWNSGNFLFSADSFLAELKRHAPDIHRCATASINDAITHNGHTLIGTHAFKQAPALPVDIAILEKSDRVAVCPVSHDWSDVGTWQGLWETSNKDAQGNVGFGDVAILNSHNNMVQSDDRLTAVVGVENIVVISTKDAVLVANKENPDDIKALMEQLNAQGRTETRVHTWSERPWGRFDVLDEGSSYKVKRIEVGPGCQLSLQKHEHRSEHWTIVAGIASIRLDDQEKELHKNQHIDIPVGAIHRIANHQSEALIIIEVQMGAILSEDDIIRLEDNYGRKTISDED